MAVQQLRLVVEATDFEEAVTFYRNALGLEVEFDLESEGGAHVVILDAGRATLEISNQAQVDLIDSVEVGRRVSPHLRVPPRPAKWWPSSPAGSGSGWMRRTDRWRPP